MFKLPDLPYSYEALEPFIDKETMILHHDKHHAAYVDNLNKALEGHNGFGNMDVMEIISNLDKVPEEIRTKVRNNGGGHANHSMFWKIMKNNNGAGENNKPTGELMSAIERDFASFDSLKEKFTNAGLGRFGSGWVWLIVNPPAGGGKLEVVDTANQDTPLMEGKKAILCLDVWEHAYYLKYKNVRADYMKAWWNVVNWEKVSEYFQKLK